MISLSSSQRRLAIPLLQIVLVLLSMISLVEARKKKKTSHCSTNCTDNDYEDAATALQSCSGASLLFPLAVLLAVWLL